MLKQRNFDFFFQLALKIDNKNFVSENNTKVDTGMIRGRIL